MLIWKRCSHKIGPNSLKLYAGKNMVGHVVYKMTVREEKERYQAITHLTGQKTTVREGTEKDCCNSLVEFVNNWFYECGYVISIKSDVRVEND